MSVLGEAHEAREIDTFDVQAARMHFPALDQSQVFFDNAGGSQVLGEVIES